MLLVAACPRLLDSPCMLSTSYSCNTTLLQSAWLVGAGEPDHLDIQALTFNKIAPIEAGRIDIRYRQVECVPLRTSA